MVSRSTAGASHAHTQHADALAQAGDLFCDLRSMDLVFFLIIHLFLPIKYIFLFRIYFFIPYFVCATEFHCQL